MKKMGLESREAALLIEHASYRCALRDVSFSGAQILTAGSASAFADKRIALKISRVEPGTDILLAGIVRRADEVGGHENVVALGIEFEGEVPMTWKLVISSYLSSVRKAPTEGAAAGNAAAPPTPSGAERPAPEEPAGKGDGTPPNG
jgi:hypothetical protein